MHNILKKLYFLLVNLVPLKSARHFLREKYDELFELHFISQEAVRKKFAFLKGDYKTVALGSSHCQTMFHPDFMESSFNFGLNSADAFMFYEMYNGFIKNTDTKNIIVFYDTFTKGSDNTKRYNFDNIFLPMKYVLKINYKGDNKRIENIVKNFEKNFVEKDDNYRGFTPLIVPIVTEDSLNERCASHLKIWGMEGGDEWIKKLAQECIKDNRNFILVISPAKKSYKKLMPDSKTLFNGIIDKLNEVEGFIDKGKIYNFYDTDDFDDESYWIDPDHTNEKGAEIVTKSLNEKLKQDNIF